MQDDDFLRPDQSFHFSSESGENDQKCKLKLPERINILDNASNNPRNPRSISDFWAMFAVVFFIMGWWCGSFAMNIQQVFSDYKISDTTPMIINVTEQQDDEMILISGVESLIRPFAYDWKELIVVTVSVMQVWLDHLKSLCDYDLIDEHLVEMQELPETEEDEIDWLNISKTRTKLTLGNDSILSIPLGAEAASYAQLPVPVISNSLLNQTSGSPAHTVTFWLKLNTSKIEPSLIIWTDQRTPCDERTGGDKSGTTLSVIHNADDRWKNSEQGSVMEAEIDSLDTYYNITPPSYSWLLEYGTEEGKECDSVLFPFLDSTTNSTSIPVQNAYEELLSSNWTQIGLVLQGIPYKQKQTLSYYINFILYLNGLEVGRFDKIPTNETQLVATLVKPADTFSSDPEQHDVNLDFETEAGDETTCSNQEVGSNTGTAESSNVLSENEDDDLGLDAAISHDLESFNEETILQNEQIHYQQTDLEENDAALLLMARDMAQYANHAWHSSFPDINMFDHNSVLKQPSPVMSLHRTKTRNDCYFRNPNDDQSTADTDLLTRILAAVAKRALSCIPSKTILGRKLVRGSHGINGSTHFSDSGRVAQLAIWENVALSPDQIETLFNEYSFEEASKTTNEIQKKEIYLPNPSFFYPLDDVSRLSARQQKDLYLERSISLRETVHSTVQNSSKISYSPYYAKLYKLDTPSLSKELQLTPKGGFRFVPYINGTYSTEVGKHSSKEFESLARKRRIHIKNAMTHAWKGYQDFAWGYDELKPVSGEGINPWGGMATTMVDSLDTLWIMGMFNEFYEARDWVRDHLRHDAVTQHVSFFETTIRSVGGLLAAYDISLDDVFLDRAEDLGYRLFRGMRRLFGTSEDTSFHDRNFANVRYVNISGTRDAESNTFKGTERANVAEIGTLQLEFRYLADKTGNKTYAERVEEVFEILELLAPENGLYPIYLNEGQSFEEITFSGPVRFGAMGDSFYEYMLKTWIQGGRMEQKYREMYDKSIDGMHSVLLQKSLYSGLTYIAEIPNGSTKLWFGQNILNPKMDHLACFSSGMLALGAYTNPDGLSSERSQRDLQTAKALAYTCYQMYARTKTGIAPEYVDFIESNDSDFRLGSRAPYYLLRPETIESFYILFALTGDPIYQEWGWEVFLAIEKFCRTPIAYGSLDNVDRETSGIDKMESFFLAETLKYLYLLFDDENEINLLETHVFTTEGHPLRILKNSGPQNVGKLIGSALSKVKRPLSKPKSRVDRFFNNYLRGGSATEFDDSSAEAYVEVIAPTEMPEGQEIEIQLGPDEVSFRAVVPKGGVKKGQPFLVPYPVEQLTQSSSSVNSQCSL